MLVYKERDAVRLISRQGKDFTRCKHTGCLVRTAASRDARRSPPRLSGSPDEHPITSHLSFISVVLLPAREMLVQHRRQLCKGC